MTYCKRNDSDGKSAETMMDNILYDDQIQINAVSFPRFINAETNGPFHQSIL